MGAKEVSIIVKTKTTFKYDYLSGFVIMSQKMRNLQTIETLKMAKNS